MLLTTYMLIPETASAQRGEALQKIWPQIFPNPFTNTAFPLLSPHWSQTCAHDQDNAPGRARGVTHYLFFNCLSIPYFGMIWFFPVSYVLFFFCQCVCVNVCDREEGWAGLGV